MKYRTLGIAEPLPQTRDRSGYPEQRMRRSAHGHSLLLSGSARQGLLEENASQEDSKRTHWPAKLLTMAFPRSAAGALRRSAKVHPCPAAVTLTSSSVVRLGAVATSSAPIAVTRATISSHCRHRYHCMWFDNRRVVKLELKRNRRSQDFHSSPKHPP
jgi:hypothetical protein